VIDFPVDPVGLLSCTGYGRTIPGGSLSNRPAFAYMIGRGFAALPRAE